MSLEHKLLEQGLRKLAISEHRVRALYEQRGKGRITKIQCQKEVDQVMQALALTQMEQEAVDLHYRKNVRRPQFA